MEYIKAPVQQKTWANIYSVVHGQEREIEFHLKFTELLLDVIILV